MSVDAYLALSFTEAMIILAAMVIMTISVGAFVFLVGNRGDV